MEKEQAHQGLLDTIEHLTQSRNTLDAQYHELYELSGKQADTIERQRGVMESVRHDLEKARIWGGMDWVYQPLHPMHYKPAIAAITKALEQP